MKQQLLKYIENFNKVAQVTIEYAALEPFYTSSGRILNNLHLVYSPTAEFLVIDYLRGGNVGDAFVEKTSKDTTKTKAMLNGFIKPNLVLEDTRLFENISTTMISNIGRFYNFKINSATDPFFTMFLEEDNIVFASKEFTNYFLDSKSLFRPSALHILDVIHASFQIDAKKSSEYGVYTNKEKYTELLLSITKTMKLYFIALNYYNTGMLTALCEEKHSLILNTLAQAYKPWEFVNECINTITTIKQANLASISPNGFSADAEREALKEKCFAFLTNRLIQEIAHA